MQTLHHRPHLSTKSQIQHWTKTLPQPNKQALLEGYISVRVGTSKVKAASKIRWFRLTPTEIILKRKNGEITRRFGLECVYECDPWPKDRSCFTLLVRFPNVAKSVVLLAELASTDDVPVWVSAIRSEIEAARKEGRKSNIKASDSPKMGKKSKKDQDFDFPEESSRKRRNSDPETPTLERFGGPPAPTAERTLKKSGMSASRNVEDDSSFDVLARRQSTVGSLSNSKDSLSFENEQNRATLSKKKNREKNKQVDKVAAETIKGNSVYFNGINGKDKLTTLKEYGIVTVGLIVFYQEIKIQSGQMELSADQIEEAVRIGRTRGEQQIADKANKVYGNGNVNAVLGIGYTIALNQAGVVIMVYGTACGVSPSKDMFL